MDSLVANVKAWFHSPFNTQMSAGGWFLFVGLLLLILAGWGMIMRHMPSEI